MAYATSTQGPRQSILSSPVAAAGYEDADTDWMYFAFSIAMTQKVNLKVYKYDTGEPDLLLYNQQYNQVGGPADTAFPASKHHVADPEDFLGYLNAYQYKDHLDPSGTTVVKGTLEEIEADLKRLSEGGLTLTAAKDVEVYGLSGQALPWSTPAQYFLAKGQTPPWVRDSGPVPEDEDEEVLPKEEPGMDDPAPEETPEPDTEPDEAPEEPVETPEDTETPEETPEETPGKEPGTDDSASDETPEPSETPEPDPEETPEPEADPAPAEESNNDEAASPSDEDDGGRTLAAYVEDGEIAPATDAGETSVPEEDGAADANGESVPEEDTTPDTPDEDSENTPAPEDTTDDATAPEDGSDADEPAEPAEPETPPEPSEPEDTTPNDTENTKPSDVTTPETPAETKPEEPAAPEEKEPEKAPEETDLSKADEMYPGGEDYDLELMPDDFFLPPFPYQGEEVNKLRKAARAAEPGGEGEGFIHNYFLWDGTVVTEDGAVESLESGTYMIAIEPLSPTSQGPADDPMMYWGFLPFTVDAETFESMAGFIEKYPIYLWTNWMWGDPVDLRSGNLIWEYEDLAIEAKERFTFTHTYESLRAGHDFSIGSGWEHPYNYSLIVTPLYLKLHTPGKPSVTYPIDYSGELVQAEDGPILSEGGSGYITTLEDGTIAEFGLQGGPVRVTKPDGKVLEFTGTERGYAASVTNGVGTFYFDYDEHDHLTTVTDSAGRSVSFAYEKNDLTQFTNADGDTLIYTYDGKHNLLTVEDFNGNVYLTNEYDSKHRVTSQYIPDRGQMTFTYDDATRTNRYEDENGLFCEITLDENNCVLTQTTPDGTETYEYDSLLRMTKKVDCKGGVWQYTYWGDSMELPASITYPDGHTEEFSYKDEQMTKKVQRDGETLTYTYDEDRLTSETDANGGTRTYEYDSLLS